MSNLTRDSLIALSLVALAIIAATSIMIGGGRIKHVWVSTTLTKPTTHAGVSGWVQREFSEALTHATQLSGEVYASLGYPLIRVPRDGVNVTYCASVGSNELRIGYVRLGVIDLLTAWRDCINYLRNHLSRLLPNASPNQLSRVGFSLISAELWRGRVVNDTLKQYPYWWFKVALTWDGYRLESLGGDQLDVEVNALNGNVTIYWRDVPEYVLPPLNLHVPVINGLNRSVARELVLKALSKYLTSRNKLSALKVIKEYVNEMSVDLVLAKLGPGGSLSKNALGLTWGGLINSSLNGEWRLYIIASEHNIPPPNPPLMRSKALNASCTFLVDLRSDSLIAFECNQVYPAMSFVEVSAAPVFINASLVNEVSWRLIRVDGRLINASIIMPNAIDLSRAGSIKLFIGWVARGSFLRNSSVSKVVKREGLKALVSVRVVWPPEVRFSVRPSRFTLNSSLIKAYPIIRWCGCGKSLSNLWPKAVIIKVVINYLGGSKTAEYVALPFKCG